jgi:peptidoglycan hydrolase CwlO-like protein
VLEQIEKQRDLLEEKDSELRAKAAQLDRNIGELEIMQNQLDSERDLLTQKDAGLEQLRMELEKWRLEIMDKREKLEEEVRERISEVSRQTSALSKPQAAAATDDTLLRREIGLRSLEEQLRTRERDLETKERTVAVEMERLERERAEVQDLWDKIDSSKKGLAAVMDEKTIVELERRKQELDALYLKISDREETIRKDEARLDGEWARLHSIEEELADLAKVLKSKEDEIKKLDGSAG